MYKSPLGTHKVNITSVTRLKKNTDLMLQTEPITKLKFSQQIPLYSKPLVHRSITVTKNHVTFLSQQILCANKFSQFPVILYMNVFVGCSSWTTNSFKDINL